MARSTSQQQSSGQRAAIYARVSDKSQDAEDKTSISEQISDMETHCQRRGLTIVARYQEVGRGWSKKRPEFQRMLADARRGRFDTIVCWKSDRLSRGMYPAAALMEVVEAHRINLQAVMDAIDLKTFGLMAAVGKIELDNFRERASMGQARLGQAGPRPGQQRPLRLPDWRRRQAGGRRSRGRGSAPRLQDVRPGWEGSARHHPAAERRRRSFGEGGQAVVRRHGASHPEQRDLQRAPGGTARSATSPPRTGIQGVRAAGGRVGRGPVPPSRG